MLALAREVNLPATAFVVAGDGDYDDERVELLGRDLTILRGVLAV